MKMKTLLLTLVITLSLTAITIAQVPSYVPTNGLVGWWPFNGNANDESGNTNHGTVSGANLTSDRFGNVNNAYNFDGVNDFIEILFNTSLNSPIGTVSAWIKTNGVLTNDQMLIYGQGQGRPTICINPNNNHKARLQWHHQLNGNPTGWAMVTSSTSVDNSQWLQIVGVYDTINLKIFINGVLEANYVSNLKQWNCSQYNYHIGAFNATSIACGGSLGISQAFKGVIDDIGSWNRILTTQEITDLYNGCQLSVSTHPNTQQININNNAQFIVGSSDPNATYQWQTDLGVGFQNLNSVGQYSGTTNDTLNVANVTMSNNNQPFRCIISSGSCSDTSNAAVLTVNNNVGINEFSKGNLFSVFPNPAQNVINIKAEAKLIGNIYSIFDNTGRVILTGKIKTENTLIELGNLSSGIYLISVEGINKQTFRLIRE